MLDAKARAAAVEPAAEPFGDGQVPLGEGFHQPLASAELGQDPLRERGRVLGVSAKLGEIAAVKCDQRGDIDQHAARPPGRRLEWFLSCACGRALGCAEKRLDRPQIAAGGGHQCLHEQQPGTGPGQVRRERRYPTPDRRSLAAPVVDRVEVPLDQPGRPEHLAGRGRVADRRHRPSRAPRTRPRRCGAAAPGGRAALVAGRRGAGRRTGGDSATRRAPHPAGSGTGPPAPPPRAAPGCPRGR